MEELTAYLKMTKKELDFMVDSLSKRIEHEEAVSLLNRYLEIQRNISSCKYSPETILNAVCHIRNVSVDDVVSRKRDRVYVDTRVLVSVIIHDIFPEMTAKNIGKLLNRNHSTVIYYYSQVSALKEFQREFIQLRVKLETYKP